MARGVNAFLLAFFWAALRLMPLSRELLLVIPNTEEGKP
jgi:hypothetical protein